MQRDITPMDRAIAPAGHVQRRESIPRTPNGSFVTAGWGPTRLIARTTPTGVVYEDWSRFRSSCDTLVDPDARTRCHRARRISSPVGGETDGPRARREPTPYQRPIVSPGDRSKPVHRFHRTRCFNEGLQNLGLCVGTYNNREALVKYVSANVNTRKEVGFLEEIANICGKKRRGDAGCQNVVTVYDIIGMPGNPRALGIVMEYLSGGNLSESRMRRSTQANIWLYIGQVLAGLRFLHQNHIIHCDIKPANIMLKQSDGQTETAVITDLGGASKRGEPIRTGSPAYMLHGYGSSATDDQDLFALVMTAYQVIDGTTLHQLSYYIQTGVPSPAATMDENIRTKRPDIVEQKAHFAERSFTLGLSEYNPTWAAVRSTLLPWRRRR